MIEDDAAPEEAAEPADLGSQPENAPTTEDEAAPVAVPPHVAALIESLDDETVEQLKDRCRDAGISGFSDADKGELVDMLSEHYIAEPPPEPRIG